MLQCSDLFCINRNYIHNRFVQCWQLFGQGLRHLDMRFLGSVDIGICGKRVVAVPEPITGSYAAKDDREKNKEQLEFMNVQATWAAIALAEATARAVQRIPDAKCNGDMHAALEYAEKVKRDQKDYLAKQGIHALY